MRFGFFSSFLGVKIWLFSYFVNLSGFLDYFFLFYSFFYKIIFFLFFKYMCEKNRVKEHIKNKYEPLTKMKNENKNIEKT